MSEKPELSTLEKLAIIERELSQDLTPSIIETPDDELIKLAALSVSEDIDLQEFLSAGCPNIQNYDKSRMEVLYRSGHDTDDLLKIFPYASRGGIAYLKVQNKWKTKREEFLEEMQYRSKLMLMNTKVKTVFTISSLLNAFNNKLESALLKYAATGDTSLLPIEFVPKSIRDAKELISLIKMFGDLKLNADAVPSTQPSTAIQINVENEKPKTVQIDALDFLKMPNEPKK